MGNYGYCFPREGMELYPGQVGVAPLEGLAECEKHFSCDYYTFWEEFDADVAYRDDYPGAYRSALPIHSPHHSLSYHSLSHH